MPAGVLIRGGGVAARCCEALLQRAGLPVQRLESDRGRVPAILVGSSAQTLLVEVFGAPDLWAGAWRIHHRVVLWGGRDPVKLPHAATVVSEQQLLSRLESAGLPSEGEIEEPSWTIETATMPPTGELIRFGDRPAEAVEATLTPAADPHACLMEAAEGGWLFVLPYCESRAWILAAGATASQLLGESQLARRWVGEATESRGSFPAAPRLIEPLCGPGWLACGSAAMGFDPLCGDGTGHAVREAILAAAVIEAAGREPAQELVEEFRLRLQGGMVRHLAQCEEFYRSGYDSAWWRRQAEDALDGLKRLRVAANGVMGRFVLEGFGLRRSTGYGTLAKP
jgi:hypothetical protein